MKYTIYYNQKMETFQIRMKISHWSIDLDDYFVFSFNSKDLCFTSTQVFQNSDGNFSQKISMDSFWFYWFYGILSF
jgi:hypothetical protein